MTDVTTDQGQDGAELSAADEQLLRERARTGGVIQAGEGGLLGKLTKMAVEGRARSWRRRETDRAAGSGLARHRLTSQT